MMKTIPAPKTHTASERTAQISVGLVSNSWPSRGTPERDRLDEHFFDLLVKDARDVAEALANPYAKRYDHIDSIGSVCTPPTMIESLVNWRDPQEQIARRATAFYHARMVADLKGN